MKFFKKESFIKKGIIVIVIVLLTNFSFPTMSRATTDVSEAIIDFMLLIPDGVMWLLQSVFLKKGDAKIEVYSDSKNEESGLWGWAVVGVASAVNPGLGIIALVGNGVYNFFKDDGKFNLPNIEYTPYMIFSNKIPMLNADFFGDGEKLERTYYYFPGEDYIASTSIPSNITSSESAMKEYIQSYLDNNSKEDMHINDIDAVIKIWNDAITEYDEGRKSEKQINIMYNTYVDAGVFNKSGESLDSIWKDVYNNEAKGNFSKFLEITKEDRANATMDLFQNTEQAIHIENFEKMNTDPQTEYLNSLYSKIEEQTDTVYSSISILKPIVSKWYNILRTIAIVGLLSVLVYIGIRILVYSTSAHDKAKYKTMLKDWLVGLCLLFVLHFIMSFTMAVTRYIGDVFQSSELENALLRIPKDTICKESDERSKLDFEEHIVRKDDGTVYWKTNTVEKIRFLIISTDEQEDANSLRLAYIIMYIVIVIEVLIFTFQYIKRVITMAMLTLISPLVALTYPIDKITDGQAQGFNMWLKEYIFNALLQPMHLILYTIIMSSAVSLVQSNPIYAIVALGCLTPMEKLLRKIFGFGKAESVGAFGGAAGAAVVMSTIGSLQKLRKKPSIGKGNEKEDGIKLWDNKKSIDAEGTLLGDPEEREGVLDKFNNKEDNSVSNTDLGTQQKDKSNKVSQKNILLQDDLDRDPTREILLPDSVDRTNIGKNTKQKMKDVQNPTPIRDMATTNKRASMPKRTIKNPRLYALGQIGKSAGRKLTRDLTIGNVAKTVAKTVAKGVTGATVGGVLGTVGLTAGIASGDFGKAVKYTTTAGVTGATLGSSLVGRGTNIVEDSIDTYQTAYASADEDYATDRRIKEFKKNEQNMKYLESRYTDRQEREEVIKTMEAAAEYGITNVQDVSAIYEMRKQEGLDMSQAIAVAKMYKQVGDISEPKARKEWQEHFESKGYSNIQVKQLLNRLEKFKKERD